MDVGDVCGVGGVRGGGPVGGGGVGGELGGDFGADVLEEAGEDGEAATEDAASYLGETAAKRYGVSGVYGVSWGCGGKRDRVEKGDGVR